MSNPAAAYTKIGRDMGVEMANPHQLVLMLYDGALLALGLAVSHLDNNDKQAMSEEIVRASNIISQGLRDSLDTKVGGELAGRLSSLYDYMNIRLQFANIKADKAIIEEVSSLLRELKDAWVEIAKDPAVVSAGKEMKG
ncbi:flagellar export chaperone FliS [Denitratisoma sp. DHT3]|uniref:flagellar export chaperone FliS n=1 Tax=Denitratisoma sp. DHT3 TaxID=1981880 RepID=UPI0016478903|nr:flagellar export chaperone FliS [Denitratisoma sp. DHT3]